MGKTLKYRVLYLLLGLCLVVMQQLFLIWKQAKSVNFIKFLTPDLNLNCHQSGKFFTPKIHRVLIFAFFLIFYFAGLFNGVAQISTLNNWSNVYHGTSTAERKITYIVPPGSSSNRILVVAIASSITLADLRTVNLTYGDQTPTSSVGDMANTNVRQHTQIYYFNEEKLDAATNSDLLVTVSGGTTRVTDVFAAVFDGVDQTNPVTDSKRYRSAIDVTTFAFATALNVNANDKAIEIISSVRSGNTVPRTITYAPNWTMADQQTWETTDGVRNAVVNRSVPTVNTTDVSSTTFSGGALASMTALSLNSFTITSFTPKSACSGSGASIVITGTNFTGVTSVTFNGLTATYTVNSSTQITATLPALATTGKISITTGAGNVQSTNDFIVNPLPVISIPPSATAICSGQDATLSVASSASSPVYQWQSASSDGGPWSYINSVFDTKPVFFESNFSSLPANTNIYGNASISGGILQLTPAINLQTGGFVIQNTPGANLTAFNANFDYRIWEGTGADGFSLSYAPNILNNPGNGNGGEGSGIIVKFDTYDNYATSDRTKSQIRIHYIDSIWGNTVGSFDLRNSNFRNVNLYVDHNGKLSLSIGGTVLVSDFQLPPGYVAADKTNWKFKFSGRTGDRNDVHQIDNLRIQYGENPVISVSPTVDTYYRAVVTSGECSVISNSALVTVNPLPTGTISTNSPICAEEDAVFSLSGTSGAIVTYNINGGADQTVTLTGGSATITISAATSNQTLNLVSIDDGTCIQNLTETATVVVNQLPATGEIIPD